MLEYCPKDMTPEQIENWKKHQDLWRIKTMIKVTPELYEQNIPKCCSYRTLQEHEEIMLCWGLVSAIENEKEMNCGSCPERIKEK